MLKIFQKMYDKALQWAKHRHAPRYLAILSFTESVIFPIPPDVMLAPMALAERSKAWQYAWLTTIASVLGGIAGYWLGYWLFDPVVQPMIEKMGYQDVLVNVEQWFHQYGVWVVFIAGFSPIPYKLFMYWGGERMQQKLRDIVDWLGWGTVLLAGVLYLIYG